MKRFRIMIIALTIVVAAAITVTAGFHDRSQAEKPAAPAEKVSVTLPAAPESYLGAYLHGVPGSYASVSAFTKASGVSPNVLVYYSGWHEPFRASFAEAAASHRAVPLVQIDPQNVSLSAIAAGLYDVYLSTYAAAVRSYGRAVIISFGHEMNGYWYSWSYRHSSAASFVSAWQHIVTVFRAAGADNVTWLWTVNVIDKQAGIPDPRPWWPGSSYVTWVGIDGYYVNSSVTFAPLFGPTIVAVKAFTDDPILVAETGATSTASEPAQMNDLFAGVRTYGLLGLVWFDAVGKKDWRLSRPAAIDAFRRGAATYHLVS